MNRFPKMVFLWEAILRGEGVEPTLALCAGYAVATYYAILKNKAYTPRKTPKSVENQRRAEAKAAQDRKTLTIPGKHPDFVKNLTYRLTRDGYEFFVADKWIGQEKVAAFLRRFTKEELEAVRKYAERLAKVIREYGYNNWFEIWKAERDKEWTAAARAAA